MECTFQSLPFLFPESQRPALLAWREAAVQRERRLEVRRQEQLQQLRQQVALRLRQLLQSNQKNQSKQENPSNQPRQQPPSCRGQPPDPSESSWSRQRSPDPPIPRSEVYSRVSARARGFLTRRLLQSSKTSSLISTIRDGGEVLAGLTDPLSQQDIALRDRVHTQMQLARITLLEIVHLPVRERMAYIAHSRFLQTQKREREKVAAGLRGGRLSLATQRAIERRQSSQTSIPAPATGSIRPSPAKPVCKPAGAAGSTSGTAGKKAGPRPVGQGTRTLQKPCPVRNSVTRVARPTSHTPSTPTTFSGQGKSGRQTKSGQQKKTTAGQPKRTPATSHKLRKKV